MKIGFIGLGKMGTPMAQNLIAAGHKVTAYNRTRAKAETLKGAQVAESPAEAGRGAEVVFTMLPDDPALEEVVFGEQGLLKGMNKDAVHVSSSTISVALSRRLDDAHREHGQRYLAAPVLGRPEAAAAAKLFVLAAGADEVMDRCASLLDVLGQEVITIGEKPEQANVAKLSCNFLIASLIEAVGEAVALARKHGIDPKDFIELLTSTIFNAPAYKTYGGFIAEEKYEPAGFPLRLGAKDMRLAIQAAEGVQMPMPLASLLRDHALAGMANGIGDLDWSALAKVAARNAGLE
jgi:3-hydroxyisobutyrate dehydrogenase-like beta-hydroxyacid dehydrogenase